MELAIPGWSWPGSAVCSAVEGRAAVASSTLRRRAGQAGSVRRVAEGKVDAGSGAVCRLEPSGCHACDGASSGCAACWSADGAGSIFARRLSAESTADWPGLRPGMTAKRALQAVS
jgi:hypothetical protein